MTNMVTIADVLAAHQVDRWTSGTGRICRCGDRTKADPGVGVVGDLEELGDLEFAKHQTRVLKAVFPSIFSD